MNLLNAKGEGYTPCRVCRPSSNEIGSAPATNSVSGTRTTLRTKALISQRCSGTTRVGSRCKRMTKALNGRCYQH